MIIDIGIALVADQPERFDVIVLPNLYGDVLSDLAAQATSRERRCPRTRISLMVVQPELVYSLSSTVRRSHRRRSALR
ncbi:MAG: isocitrate/isopropylmalate family dehydrogenase [Burkholderiales bacterium]